MTAERLVLPFARGAEPVRYVVIDDEPRYRQPLAAPSEAELQLVGAYGSVDAFIGIHRQPCHVVVLDLCLNRRTGDPAVLQGVRAIRQLAGEYGHRLLVHTADERPEPVARCVAAGAVGFISKYSDPAFLATAIDEIGRHGQVVTEAINQALLQLAQRCRDIRLSDTLEQTLVLLDRGMTDTQIAEFRQLSPRTIEDHKRKILEVFGANMEAQQHGFAHLTRELGIATGDLINDPAGHRPVRGTISRALAWTKATRRRNRP